MTDRIDLESFFPYFALLAELMHRSKPTHFAGIHPIINNVNPGTPPITLPDGWSSRVCIVDDFTEWMDQEGVQTGDAIMKWFPRAQSASVARKLMLRIIREGCTLPILTAIGLSILAEIYTTTSGSGTEERRTRLRYKSSPIADFGIAKGSVVVTDEDKLAYIKRSDRSIVHGQDPTDHYWLYFTTIRGEELLLDFGMFTFNMCTMVPTEPYVPEDAGHISSMISHVPVFFGERTMRTGAPPLHKEERRMSILRASPLHEAIVHTQEGLLSSEAQIIYDFMTTLAERELTQEEKVLACEGTISCCSKLAYNLRRRTWAAYPPTADLLIHHDPGELSDTDDRQIPNFDGRRRRARMTRRA